MGWLIGFVAVLLPVLGRQCWGCGAAAATGCCASQPSMGFIFDTRMIGHAMRLGPSHLQCGWAPSHSPPLLAMLRVVGTARHLARMCGASCRTAQMPRSRCAASLCWGDAFCVGATPATRLFSGSPALHSGTPDDGGAAPLPSDDPPQQKKTRTRRRRRRRRGGDPGAGGDDDGTQTLTVDRSGLYTPRTLQSFRTADATPSPGEGDGEAGGAKGGDASGGDESVSQLVQDLSALVCERCWRSGQHVPSHSHAYPPPLALASRRFQCVAQSLLQTS